MKRLRVLVACEFTGTVRDAFAARGWDAWSCDLRDSETPGNHVTGDVIPLLKQPWNLLIAHPPCTYLTNAGAKHLYEEWTWQDQKASVEDTGRRLLGHSRRRDESRWQAIWPHGIKTHRFAVAESADTKTNQRRRNRNAQTPRKSLEQMPLHEPRTRPRKRTIQNSQRNRTSNGRPMGCLAGRKIPVSTEYIPDELPEPMKASELAALLMKHPDAIVYVDYIPYDRGCNFSVEYNESTNTLILES